MWRQSPAGRHQIRNQSVTEGVAVQSVRRWPSWELLLGYWHQQTEQRGGLMFLPITLFRVYCSSVLYTRCHTIPVTLQLVSVSFYGQVLRCCAKPQHKFLFFPVKPSWNDFFFLKNEKCQDTIKVCKVPLFFHILEISSDCSVHCTWGVVFSESNISNKQALKKKQNPINKTFLYWSIFIL